MMIIPKQLQVDSFRFIHLRYKPGEEKKAREPAWQKIANYSYNDNLLLNGKPEERIKGINETQRYGVVCGENDLVVIDIDDLESVNKILEAFPQTFTVQTGGGGIHLYYRTDNTKKRKLFLEGRKKLGEMQGKGAYVCGPNSVYDLKNPEKRYVIKVDKDILFLDINKIDAIFDSLNIKFFMNRVKKDKKVKRKIPSFIKNDIDKFKEEYPLERVMKQYGYNIEINNQECRIPGENNLPHQSKGKQCFSPSYDTGLWYCHNCGEGGSSIDLVMAHEKLSLIEVIKEYYNSKDDYVKIILLYIFQNKLNKATELMCELLSDEKLFFTRGDDKNEAWIYKDGIYIPEGKSYIKEFCREKLNDYYSINFVNKVIDKLEVDNFIEQDEFFKEEDINKIPLLNGIFDIRTRKLEEYSSKYRFFNKLNVKYDESKTCPNIINFFKSVLKEENEILVIQELFGSLLERRYRIQKAFMFLGDGRNGKGITTGLIKRFVGTDNCRNISLEAMDKDKFAKGELFKKLVNISADNSKKLIRETGELKSLIGEDEQTAPRKFLSPVNFINYAKMIFACNELPMTADQSEGFFNRWIIIDFPYTFLSQKEINKRKELKLYKVANPDILDSISTSGELSGLLNWSLDGLDRLYKQNDFSYSASTEDVKEKWSRESNSFNGFVKDCLEKDFDNYIIKQKLKEEYGKYCQKHNIRPVNDKSIKYILTTEMYAGEIYKVIDGERQYCWNGIKFKDEKLNYKEEENFGISVEQKTEE